MNYLNAKENYVNEKNTMTQIYGQDKHPYNEKSIYGYVAENPESKEYFEEGQTILLVNAAMDAKGKYTPWLYFPPQNVHTTKVWHDTVVYGLDAELEEMGLI